MARSNDPDSADSQFFICYDSHPFLDGKYTAWGKVIEGMNIIDRIPEGKGPNGQVLSNATKIITMRIKIKKIFVVKYLIFHYILLNKCAPVAQLVEHSPFKGVVMSSNLIGRAILR